MRVLQVVTDTDRRGAQVFATDLAPGLTAMGASVHTVALAAGRTGGLTQVEPLGATPLGRDTLTALRRMARRTDVVIAHGSTTLPACAAALVGRSAPPFVYRQISDPRFWANTPARRARTALLVRRAASIVALSPGVAATFAAHYGLDARDLSVIPNAVPAAGFRPATADDRRRQRAALDISAQTPVFLSLSALVPEKRVDDAIRAVSSHPDAVLVIAGAGPEEAALRQLAAVLAPERTIFTGSVSEVLKVLHAADALLMPTGGGDSMPAAIIEAALCAVPAIACPIGAIPEMVAHGKTGIIVPVGDAAALESAIRHLSEDSPARRRLGIAARQAAERHFTIDKVAPRWAKVLAATTATPRVRGRLEHCRGFW